MNDHQKKIYNNILMILSVLLIIGLFFYIYKNGSSFEKIKHINMALIFLLISLHALNFFLLGITHFYPLRRHSIFLTFKEWYGLCTIGELFNLLLPAKGGTGIRMMYMNDKKGLSKREFLSMGLAVVISGFTLLGLVGTIYCHFFLGKSNIIFIALESLFIALTISSFLLLFATELASRLFKINRNYSPKKYLKDKKLILISTLCYLGMFLLYPFKTYLSFKAIGVDINPTDSFEISLIILGSSFFQILPGNLGVKEFATIYIANQYGINFESALLASLVDRAILMLFLFPLGAYFYWSLFLDATLPEISLARTLASSLIPLKKRLLKFRWLPLPR